MTPASCRRCGLWDCVCALFDTEEEGETMDEIKTQEEAPKGPRKGGPGSRSVTVPAEAFRAKMGAAGFAESTFGGEVTFHRAHARCCHCAVTIYSSLPARGGDSRGCGEDAIRVTAVFSRQTPGRDRPYVKVIAKTARVFRTGSSDKVLERTIERAREAYAEVNAFLKEGGCFECCKKGEGR